MKMGIKLISYGALGLILNNLSFLAPAINNSLAISQMNNDNFSLVAVNWLNSYEQLLWCGFWIIGILIFQKDIRKLVKKGLSKNE